MSEMAIVDIQYNTAQSTLVFQFSGRLDAATIYAIWQQCLTAQKKYQPNTLVIDAKNIAYADSAGISLLLKLKSIQEQQQKKFALNDLAEEFYHSFELANKGEKKLIEPLREKQKFLPWVGKSAVLMWGNFTNNLAFIGELCVEVLRVLSHPSRLRWKDFWKTMEAVGPNALFIIMLLGFLMGLIMAFQSAIPLKTFGAMVYVINIVGISLSRELAPLMVAIILAGRTASSFAAEIGTMKVNQEIDALTTMGLKPLLFLVVPRVLAVMLMSPILSIFMLVAGLLGCWLFMQSIDFSTHIFLTQLNAAVTVGDMIGGLFKSLIFGIIIAGIGCMHGLRTRFGASAVGTSTTHAVVSCIVMIVVVDGIFAVLFYVLGI